MAKQFLFIVDPLMSLNVKTDTTLALIEEAHARGIHCFACEIKDITIKDGHLFFMCARIELYKGYDTPPGYLDELAPRASFEFDVIFMRKDPPVDESFLAALLMLRCFDKKETVMINDPDGLLLANEKLFGQKIASALFPRTLVSSNKTAILQFMENEERIVIKPLFKAGGAGVLVFEPNDRNIISALELMTNGFSVPVIVQAYIEGARLGDKRIIVLGGEAIGSIMRIPMPKDNRANLHAGGEPIGCEMSERDLEIVATIKPHLLKLGLHFVGIDVINGFLTEINVTSPTGILEIEQLSQKQGELPIRAQVLNYIEKLIA